VSTRGARRAVHNEIAECYHQFRPGYADAIADDVAFLASLPAGGRILEVGCGTGHATALFVPRGYDVTALEPGESMARVTRRRFQEFPNIRVIESTFEAWEPDGEAYDLVLAASSLQLVEPEHRFAKPARLLKPGGSLAVMWHDREPGATPVHRAVAAAYAAHAPSLEVPSDLGGIPLEDHLDDSGLYQAVFMRRYRWTREYPADEFVNFLESYATHRLLPAPERAALYPSIRGAILAAGGTIVQHFTTRLWVARRREG
jgi:SAM-dependent methyltransferase